MLSEDAGNEKMDRERERTWRQKCRKRKYTMKNTLS